MDTLQGYGSSGSDEEGEIVESQPHKPLIELPKVDLSPAIFGNTASTSTITIYNEKDREISYNPKYDELFKPDVSFLSNIYFCLGRPQ